ncbi:MAG: hypothetical protein KDK90_23735 [Leptospiraceae bacterium]|nr:hypothetical protein [Leptospiraceae bacterium]
MSDKLKNMKETKISKNYFIFEFLFVVLFFFPLAIYHFYPVLASNQKSITTSIVETQKDYNFYGIFRGSEQYHQDGIGAIVSFQKIDQEAKNLKIPFYEDIHKGFKTDLGIGNENFFPPIFRNMFITFSFLFLPDTAYEFHAFIGFIFNTIIFYILLRYFQIAIPLSFLGAILFSHLDMYYYRLFDHAIAYSFIFIHLLLILFTIRAVKTQTIPNYIVLAIISAIALEENTYYGYFGFFFCLPLFIGYTYLQKRNGIVIKTGKLITNMGISALTFFICMSLLFPNQFFFRIVHKIFGTAATSTVQEEISRTYINFEVFSVRNIFSLFEPGIWAFPGLQWLQKIFPTNFFATDLWEFTYRIGIIIPLTVLVLYITFLIGKKRNQTLTQNSTNYTVAEASVWLIAIFFIALFGISPDYSLSLVPFTYKIMPALRVGARAFVYVDIGLVFLFCYLLDRFLKYISRRNQICLIPTTVAIIAIMLLALLDATYNRVYKQLPALDLPPLEDYQILKNKPEGILIELPFFYPSKQPGEYSYLYAYNVIGHDKPIFNQASNPKYLDQIEAFARTVNHLDEGVLEQLQRTGVKYLVVNKGKRKIGHVWIDNDDWLGTDILEVLERSPVVNTLLENEKRVIVEFKTVPGMEFKQESPSDFRYFLDYWIYK